MLNKVNLNRSLRLRGSYWIYDLRWHLVMKCFICEEVYQLIYTQVFNCEALLTFLGPSINISVLSK